MIAKSNTPTYISFLGAAGVGCYGFQMEGFECVATNELLERRLAVQKANCKCRFETGYIAGDITLPDSKEKVYAEVERWSQLGNDRVDVIMATPPCQGISVINHKKKEEIKRNSLVVESVEIIQNIRPRIFLFENVLAFQKTLCVTRDEVAMPIGRFIQRELGRDYVISGRVLNFMNYGSNSSRTRTLVVGVDRDYRNTFVPYDLFPPFRKEPTLRDVIGDSEHLDWGQISDQDFYHAFRTYDEGMREWIHDLLEGESAFDNADADNRPHRIVNGVRVENIQKNRDKYTRQKWNRFVQCVHTRNDQLAAQNTIHPVEDRVFSIRELMKMMSVPTEFKWMPFQVDELNALPESEKRRLYRVHETNIRQCLGEAVPTEVIRQIAATIRVALSDKNQTAAQMSRIISQYDLFDVGKLGAFVSENPLGLSIGALTRIAELCNSKREENEAFYTNKFMVNEIMNYLPDFGKPVINILEPSAGVGNFLPFLFKRYSAVPHVRLDVLDIDPVSISFLQEFVRQIGIPTNFELNIICDDFLTHDFETRYDLVVGNPPFSKISVKNKKYDEARMASLTQNSVDLAELFLERAMSLGGCVAFVLNKTLLESAEYAATRNFLRRAGIRAILDFGRYGFTGVSIETMCLIIEPKKTPNKTTVFNMKYNMLEIKDQFQITDPTYPYFLAYRNEGFDRVAKTMTFGVFDVVRDRQITKALLKEAPSRSRIRVVKARNITDDGKVVVLPGYDKYIEMEDAKRCAIFKFYKDRSVYLVPNMTYNPRMIPNSGDWLPDGSVAVLVPKKGMRLSARQMAFFATDEFRKFYAVARNLSTQSINIDKNSVFFFGALNND